MTQEGATKTYSVAERNAFGKIVRRQFDLKGFKTQVEFAEFSNLGPVAVGRLLRTISDRMSFSIVVEFCLALDIDIYEVIKVLNLDANVKKIMQEEPEYFTTLSWMKEYSRSPNAGPIDELLEGVPEERKELAKASIESLITTFKK